MVHPSTRHPMRGITRGDVGLEWARRHHRTWVEAEEAAAALEERRRAPRT